MKGKCPECDPTKPERELIAGKCQIHYWESVRRKSFAKNGFIKARSSVSDRGMSKALIEQYPSYTPEITSLIKWYQYQAGLWIIKCENCGDIINMFSEHAIISAQAHIIPKEYFKSVAIHPANCIHLCNQYSENNCHGIYDSCWEKAYKMPVWPLAVERFMLFYDKIHPQERRKLPEILKELLWQNVS